MLKHKKQIYGWGLQNYVKNNIKIYKNYKIHNKLMFYQVQNHFKTNRENLKNNFIYQ